MIYNLNACASGEVAVPRDEGCHRFRTKAGSFGKFTTPLYMSVRSPST